MKKTISVISVLLCIMCIFTGCAEEKKPTDHDGFKLASSKDSGYSFYVPEDWKIETSTLYTSAYKGGNDMSSLSVSAYGANFVSPTVEAWWEDYKLQLGEAFEDFKLVSEEEAEMAGIKGKQYVYTAIMAERQYNFMMTAVVEDQYVYFMLYTSTPDFYEKNLEDVKTAIKYFEISK